MRPDHADTWNNKADLLYDKLHRYDEALVACEAALAFDDTSIRGWAILGDVRATLDQPVAAAAAYERAYAFEPQNALGWEARGRALIGLQNYPAALDALTQALTLDPKDADTWRLKVKALYGLGWDNEAREAERRADELAGK